MQLVPQQKLGKTLSLPFVGKLMKYPAFVRTRHFTDTCQEFVRKIQMCDTYDVTMIYWFILIPYMEVL